MELIALSPKESAFDFTSGDIIQTKQQIPIVLIADWTRCEN